MTNEIGEKPKVSENPMNITVSRDGPYIVTGRIPLIVSEIHSDEKGNCIDWREIKRYPLKEQYTLCRCGYSQKKPFCDGTHIKIHFDGTEAGDYKPYSEGAKVISGPVLTLTDNKHFCMHAEFCLRAGGIWKLVTQSDDP